jgi:tRNA-specific 2-thiouridylase
MEKPLLSLYHKMVILYSLFNSAMISMDHNSGFESLFASRKTPKPRRVVAAMSGGVDSTFAAAALATAGVEVIGVHFKMGDFPAGRIGPPRCCSWEDARDGRRMAARLGIPFYVVSAEEDFAREVIAPFARAYASGRTPNPCILCNPRIKWRLLARLAQELGAEAIATGHHARVVWGLDRGPHLLQGVEKEKDQSYFLARLAPELLAQALLPAGYFRKKDIRAWLAGAGLDVATKAESQDVCFVGPDGYETIVERCLGPSAPPPGEIVDRDGAVLGRHPGIHHFTVGQRRGLNLPGPTPHYVLGRDALRARVVGGPEEALFQTAAAVEDWHWLGEPPSPAETCAVRIRYQSAPASARVVMENRERGRLVFSQAQRAQAPGQTAGIYRGGEVLGWAPISSPRPESVRGFSFPSLGHARGEKGAAP